MTKLSWAYSDSHECYTADYRGFTVKAVHDSDAENPFTAWGCEPPTLVYSGRRDGFSDYSDRTVADALAAISDGKISRHWRAIAKALGEEPAAHEVAVREAMAEVRHNARRGYGKATTARVRRELFSELLAGLESHNGSDYLEALAALWRIAGVACESWSSNGYSQGDWAEGLSVATPEWVEKVGAPKSSHARQCAYAGKLYGYWAWGDVYGFVIENANGEELDGMGNSVWGFYGDDYAESGLEEAAREAIDSHIEERRKSRQAKAREIIKARVPLALRPAILDSAEAAR